MFDRTDIFFQQLASPYTGELIFDCLPDIVYFVKNRQGQYEVINQTLVKRAGLQDKSQLMGRTASEVLGEAYGQGFEEQDQQVIMTKQPLTNKLELHAYTAGQYGWCLTNKLPLLDDEGEAVGLVGVSQDLRSPDLSSIEYEQLSTALKYTQQHLSESITVEQIAEVSHLSVYQLNRRIERVFGLTTGQWLLKLRIDLAQRQLSQTDLPIATIALNAGYGDQSAFSRQFLRTTSMSPSAYRAKHR